MPTFTHLLRGVDSESTRLAELGLELGERAHRPRHDALAPGVETRVEHDIALVRDGTQRQNGKQNPTSVFRVRF